jgi:hypothetical protein
MRSSRQEASSKRARSSDNEDEREEEEPASAGSQVGAGLPDSYRVPIAYVHTAVLTLHRCSSPEPACLAVYVYEHA